MYVADRALLSALRGDSKNHRRLLEMRVSRLRPVLAAFKHGAGHLARPRTGPEPNRTYWCTHISNPCCDRAAAAVGCSTRGASPLRDRRGAPAVQALPALCPKDPVCQL